MTPRPKPQHNSQRENPTGNGKINNTEGKRKHQGTAIPDHEGTNYSLRSSKKQERRTGKLHKKNPFPKLFFQTPDLGISFSLSTLCPRVTAVSPAPGPATCMVSISLMDPRGFVGNLCSPLLPALSHIEGPTQLSQFLCYQMLS